MAQHANEAQAADGFVKTPTTDVNISLKNWTKQLKRINREDQALSLICATSCAEPIGF